MSHLLITAPTTEPITLAEAKAQCRVDGSVEDALLAIYIGAAREAAEHRTSRKFMEQIWEMQLDAFPENEIKLPFKGVTTIDSIKYIDTSGDEITLDSANYRLIIDTLEDWVFLADGQVWPEIYDAAQAVKIRFKVGVSDAALVPISVKQWMLLAVGLWYKNRESASDTGLAELPRDFACGLLDSVWIPVL